MKIKHIKYFLIIALVASFFACTKDEGLYTPNQGTEDNTEQNSGIVLRVAAAASVGIEGTEANSSRGTRAGFTDNNTAGVDVWWENNATNVDEISIYNANTEEFVGKFTYIGTNGESVGEFEQNGNFSMPNDEYIAVYPAVDSPTLDQRDNLDLLVTTQTSNNSIEHLRSATRMKSQPFAFDINNESNNVTLNQELVMITLRFTLSTENPPNSISLRDGVNETYTHSLDFATTIDNTYTAYFLIKPTSTAEKSSRFVHYKVTNTGGDRFDHTVVINNNYVAGKRYDETITRFNGLIPVHNRADLEAVNDYKIGNYFLADDIDLSGKNWVSLTPYTGAAGETVFSGTIDGNGKTISNLTIDEPTSINIGLFSAIKGATIKNLNIANAKINAQKYIGAIAGRVLDDSTKPSIFINCNIKGGTVSTSEILTTNRRGDVGGLIGLIDTSSKGLAYVIACTNSATIIGYDTSAAGIVGAVVGGSIIACHNSGTVKSEDQRFGGILGYGKNTDILGCFNTGNIIFDPDFTGAITASSGGGIIGYADSGIVTENSYYLASNIIGGVSSSYGTRLDSASLLNSDLRIGYMNNSVKSKVSGVRIVSNSDINEAPIILAPNIVEIL